jgi:transcriptional regulator with XRE-family HTH domain
MKFTKPDDVFRRLLKNLRTARNITQAELAARLGQPQSYVSKYETGERRLDFVETVVLCEALDVDVVQFAASYVADLTKARAGKGG